MRYLKETMLDPNLLKEDVSDLRSMQMLAWLMSAALFAVTCVAVACYVAHCN